MNVLTEPQLIAPAYFIVAGTKSGEVNVRHDTKELIRVTILRLALLLKPFYVLGLRYYQIQRKNCQYNEVNA